MFVVLGFFDFDMRELYMCPFQHFVVFSEFYDFENCPLPESQMLLLSILRCSNTPAENARPQNFGHVKLTKWWKTTHNNRKPSEIDGFGLKQI